MTDFSHLTEVKLHVGVVLWVSDEVFARPALVITVRCVRWFVSKKRFAWAVGHGRVCLDEVLRVAPGRVADVVGLSGCHATEPFCDVRTVEVTVKARCGLETTVLPTLQLWETSNNVNARYLVCSLVTGAGPKQKWNTIQCDDESISLWDRRLMYHWAKG